MITLHCIIEQTAAFDGHPEIISNLIKTFEYMVNENIRISDLRNGREALVQSVKKYEDKK